MSKIDIPALGSGKPIAESEFRLLADNMPVMCWIADSAGYFRWFNRRWYEFSGTTEKEMQGWGWRSIHEPGSLPRVLEQWKKSLASGEPFEMVFPLRSRTGEYRQFLTRAEPYRDETGNIKWWFGNNVEITAQRAAEAALRELNENLEIRIREEVRARQQAQERAIFSERFSALGQLAGGVAHDFNNVLQVMLAGTRLLFDPRNSEQQKRALLDGMERAARNAAQLVKSLLAFARKQQLSPELVDVNELLRSLMPMLRPTLGPSIECEVDLDPQLPELSLDPAQFEVAVLNLAINAKDAMPNGGKLRIRTKSDFIDKERAFDFHERLDSRNYIWLFFEDDGEGIAPDKLSRIFDPFFTTKAVGRGTGLGLPQVIGFVRQSGGDIAVRSEIGGGTTFALILPQATPEASQNLEEESASCEIVAAGGRRTILVVEDNPEVAEFVCLTLQMMGYSTLRASSGARALALLEAGQAVDAIVSDVIMPGETDGVALAEEVLSRWPDIAIVLGSGYTDKLGEIRKLPVVVLAKPYTLEALSDALKGAFERVMPARRPA